MAEPSINSSGYYTGDTVTSNMSNLYFNSGRTAFLGYVSDSNILSTLLNLSTISSAEQIYFTEVILTTYQSDTASKNHKWEFTLSPSQISPSKFTSENSYSKQLTDSDYELNGHTFSFTLTDLFNGATKILKSNEGFFLYFTDLNNPSSGWFYGGGTNNHKPILTLSAKLASNMYYYTGSKWENVQPYYYDGSNWIKTKANYYSDDKWNEI